MSTTHTAPSVEATSPDALDGAQEILTPEALDFLGQLHARFDARRLELLEARTRRRAEAAAAGRLDFLPETRAVREIGRAHV